jgi:hypothetical protein
MPQADPFRRALLAALLLLAGRGAAAADTPADTPADATAAVRQALMAAFDKPEARLQVAPVVVVGDAALAGWTQADRGGRALLRRRGADWRVAACGGDGLKDPALLRDTGVPPASADALVRQLTAAEARLPAAQRARFSSFDGLLRMDAGAPHPPAHRH